MRIDIQQSAMVKNVSEHMLQDASCQTTAVKHVYMRPYILFAIL